MKFFIQTQIQINASYVKVRSVRYQITTTAFYLPNYQSWVRKSFHKNTTQIQMNASNMKVHSLRHKIANKAIIQLSKYLAREAENSNHNFTRGKTLLNYNRGTLLY